MYKIIGADGQPYGPVTADQLRRWITEGRANARTLAQKEGSPEWKPLGELPDFAETFTAAGVPPTIQPLSPPPPTFKSAPSVNADALAAEILARDYHLEIGRCFSRSWDLVMKHFWLLVGATFVVGLIQGVAGIFLVGPCIGGLYFLFLKLIRGQRAEFGDAFAGFSLAFLQLFLVGLISNLLALLGFLLCILPGIYLTIAWIFAEALVIDKNLEFWPAMELSRRVISRHWWKFLLMMVVSIGVGLVGFAVCCVGIYVAEPIILGAFAYAYDDIFGRPVAPRTSA